MNSSPNDKILNQSNLKAFADDILNVVQMIICVTDWVENIVGKGENAGYQHFLLFPQCFQKASFPVSLKGMLGKDLNVALIVFFVFDTIENILRKGEIADEEHVLFFPQCFLKLSLLGSLKLM